MLRETQCEKLTVVAIPAEELVEANEVWSVTKVWSLGDEDLFDERKGVDDDARRGAQGYAVDFAVYFAEVGQGLEWTLVLPQEMKAADNGPWFRTRQSATV